MSYCRDSENDKMWTDSPGYGDCGDGQHPASIEVCVQHFKIIV